MGIFQFRGRIRFVSIMQAKPWEFFKCETIGELLEFFLPYGTVTLLPMEQSLIYT